MRSFSAFPGGAEAADRMRLVAVRTKERDGQIEGENEGRLRTTYGCGDDNGPKAL